jgi:hypothetical protein
MSTIGSLRDAHARATNMLALLRVLEQAVRDTEVALISVDEVRRWIVEIEACIRHGSAVVVVDRAAAAVAAAALGALLDEIEQQVTGRMGWGEAP